MICEFDEGGGKDASWGQGGPLGKRFNGRKTMDKIERMGPVNIPCVVTPLDQAMPLRDYFAAKAMAGCLAYSYVGPNGNWQENATPEGVAEYAYKLADAMLAERDKRP